MTLERGLKDYTKSDFNEKKRFIILGMHSVDLRKMVQVLTNQPDNQKFWHKVVRIDE